MTDPEFEHSQSDKLAAWHNDRLKNDRAVERSSTFFGRAAVELELEGQGRFASGAVVSGAEPAVRYPAAAQGPWGGPMPGLEPPFPADISVVEPVGTAAEIAASIAQLAGDGKPAALSLAGSHDDSASIPSSAIPLAASGRAPAMGTSGLPPADAPSAVEQPGAAIQRQAHARLAELLPQAIRRRRVT